MASRDSAQVFALLTRSGVMRWTAIPRPSSGQMKPRRPLAVSTSIVAPSKSASSPIGSATPIITSIEGSGFGRATACLGVSNSVPPGRRGSPAAAARNSSGAGGDPFAADLQRNISSLTDGSFRSYFYSSHSNACEDWGGWSGIGWQSRCRPFHPAVVTHQTLGPARVSCYRLVRPLGGRPAPARPTSVT